MKEIEKERAKRRQTSNLKQGTTAPVKEMVPEREKGQTRDKIAEKIGFGGTGRTLERGLKIYEAAKDDNQDVSEELKQKAKESLKKLDNKETTVNAEYKKLFKGEVKEGDQQKPPESLKKLVDMKPKRERKIKSDPDLTEQQLFVPISWSLKNKNQSRCY